MMIYEDATRKKKVYDWKKEVPLNKTIVAKVEELFSNDYIKLSTRYFDQKLDPSELRKELMKPFSDNKVLITTMKKICRNNNLDFNTFWSNVIYKINDEKRSNELNMSLLDYILENKELFNNIIKENYSENYEKIIDQYEKQISIKIYKIQSKFSLITKNSIENSKELLKLKLRLYYSKSLDSLLTEEQDEFNYVKQLNKELCINSKEDYVNKQFEHINYISQPEEYFKLKGVWTNWYDFMGINTSKFIQNKNDWVNFCKENNVKSLIDYNNLCKLNELLLPANPADFYKEFISISIELELDTKRRK